MARPPPAPPSSSSWPMRAWSWALIDTPRAPVGAAGNRVDAADAGQIDPGVVVALPGEAFAATERAQHLLEKDLRQRPAKQVQQRQRELVDAHVVVFPVRARRLQRPRAALGPPAGAGRCATLRQRSTVSGRPKQLPSHSLVCVSRWVQVTARLCSLSKPMPGRRATTGSSSSGSRPCALGHAGEQREVGLGDAEGQVGATGFAPRTRPPRRADARRPTAGRAHAPGRAGD